MSEERILTEREKERKGGKGYMGHGLAHLYHLHYRPSGFMESNDDLRVAAVQQACSYIDVFQSTNPQMKVESGVWDPV